MAFLQPHTANLTSYPALVAPLAGRIGRKKWVEANFRTRLTSQTFTPNNLPTRAVKAIAVTPQPTTLNVAGNNGAPPALAPSAPSTASAATVTTNTVGAIGADGAKNAAITGIAAARLKVKPEVIAA